MHFGTLTLVLALATTSARAQAPGDDTGAPPPDSMVGAQVRTPPSAHVRFMSTTDLQWDVTIDQQPACATPCDLLVPELGFVTLHSHEDPPIRLEVGYLQGTNVIVAAEPLHRAEYATGVTFTALGATALATGITLGAVGYGTSNSGMKTAGYACAIPGALVLAGAIWLIEQAAPRAHIRLDGTF